MARYAIGLGSNRRHGRYGAPESVVRAAFDRLEQAGVRIEGQSRLIRSRPLGPSQRTYTNAAAIVVTEDDPPGLLAKLKAIERAFGRRAGRRWGARVIDLDIVLWSGGAWRSRRPALRVPHPELARRRFVLDPLAEIAPDWRVPGLGTVRQLRARLTRARPLHRN